jgi:hypothetical protein
MNSVVTIGASGFSTRCSVASADGVMVMMTPMAAKPARQDVAPPNVHRRIGRIAADVCELAGAQLRVRLRMAVHRHPEQQPRKADRAGDDERPVPAIRQGDPGDDQL